MGYNTRYTLTIQKENLRLADSKAVQDIQGFLMRSGFDIGEHTVVRMMTELSEHFRSLDVEDSEIFGKLEEISTYDFDEDGFTEGKWYDHEKDMKVLSGLYPNIVFTLDGEGEEQGDVWKKTFKDGKLEKSRKARIVFDD